MRKRLLWICAAALLLLAGCAGGGRGQAVLPQEAAAVTVVDMMGRELRLDKPAKRVVALSAADCEIVYALGAGELLVGRGEYCDFPPEALSLPVVGSGSNTNVEEIIALQPDVLVMGDMAQTLEQTQMLEKAGVPILISNANSVEETYTAIRNIGTLLGKEEEAHALVADMEDVFAQLRAQAGGARGKTVYFEVSPLPYGLWAAGGDTFMDEVAQMLGLVNIFGEEKGWVQVSEEQVIERAPDYIVSAAMYDGEGRSPEEEILSRPGWENIPALREGRILNLHNNELSRPGPRIAEGARALADFVYGE